MSGCREAPLRSAGRGPPFVGALLVVVAGEAASPGDGVVHGGAVPPVGSADEKPASYLVGGRSLVGGVTSAGRRHVDGDGRAGTASEPLVDGERRADQSKTAACAVAVPMTD